MIIFLQLTGDFTVSKRKLTFGFIL